MAKAKRKKTIRVPVTDLEEQMLKDVSVRLNISMAETYRRSLPIFLAHLENLDAGGFEELKMLGDSSTVALKKAFIKLVSEGDGELTAAKTVGITSQTFRHWMKSDEVFAHLAQEAWALVIEKVQSVLIKMSLGMDGRKPNLTAIFGFLNATHPAYGLIRQHAAEWLASDWVNGCVKIAEKCFPLDLIPKFAEEVKVFSDDLFSKAGSRRK